nr:hypothetical protein HK105_004838 [Polyrhizophydium stewartii]
MATILATNGILMVPLVLDANQSTEQFAKLLPKLCRIVPWTTRRSALPFLVAAIASADSADLKVRKTLYDCLLISGWQSVEWPKSFSPLPELLDMLECDYADARKSAAYALQGFIQSEAFLASQKDAIKESRLAGRLAEMIRSAACYAAGSCLQHGGSHDSGYCRRTDKEKHTIALRPTLMLFKRVTPDLVPMLLENDLLGALVKYSLGLLVAPAGEEIDPQPGDFELLGTQILCIVYVWTLTICRPSDSFSIMCHGATRFIIDAARRLANSADKFGSRRVAVDGFEPLELDEALMSATRALRKMIELSTQKDFQIDWIPIIFNFGLVPALHAIIDHRDKMIPILKDSIERVLERYDCEAVNLAQVDMEACGMDVLLYRHNNSSRVVKKFFDYISDKADPTPIPNPANEDLVSRSLLRSARSKSRTRVEIRYLQLLGSLLSLPDWWDIFDTPGGPEKLLSHAREYALPDVTEDMLQLAMQELEYRAANEVQTVFGINGTRAIIVPGPVEQTFVSHDAAPAELCKLLARQSHDLEDVPERLVDWRAGTNDMVRDLVNPSLFCLVYGTTVVAASSQRRRHTMQMSLEDLERYGRVTKPPGSVDAAQHASQRFQWLPAEFRVNDDSSIAIQSFINNLHPVWHRDIYKSIAKLFGCFVPLFEMQFGEFRVFDRFRCLHDNPQRMQINIDLWAKRRARELEILELKHVARGDEEVPQDEVAPFAHFSPLDDANDEPAAGQESAAAVSPASSTQEQTTGRKVFRGSPMRFTHEEIKALDAEFGSEDNPLHLPQLPKIFSAPATPLAPANLRGRNLQVIVRMSNIYLTPAKPVYQPDWAVHGSWNEPIVVTGILCYDVANIADPRLAFRRPVMAFSTRVLEPDGDPRVRPETNTQFLGRIALKEGCSLSFPNLFQHKFENIELADATQPGHLKMLEFHVIDPAMSLVSTAHVSPQQLEWYAVGLEGRLPPELLTLMIKDKVKLDEAKRFQREFELERAALGAVLNRTL